MKRKGDRLVLALRWSLDWCNRRMMLTNIPIRDKPIKAQARAQSGFPGEKKIIAWKASMNTT